MAQSTRPVDSHCEAAEWKRRMQWVDALCVAASVSCEENHYDHSADDGNGDATPVVRGFRRVLWQISHRLSGG